MTMLTSIAGIDNEKAETCEKSFQHGFSYRAKKQSRVVYVQSTTQKDLQLHEAFNLEAVAIQSIRTNVKLPRPKNGIRISKLEARALKQILARPPLLLVSTALLLYHLGILSYMASQEVWRTEDECSVFWNLAVYRMRNMQRFRDAIGFLSPDNNQRLARHTKTQSSPSPFFLTRVGGREG